MHAPAHCSASHHTDDGDHAEHRTEAGGEVPHERQPDAAKQPPPQQHRQPRDHRERGPRAEKDRDRRPTAGHQASREQLGQVAPLGGEEHDEAGAGRPQAAPGRGAGRARFARRAPLAAGALEGYLLFLLLEVGTPGAAKQERRADAEESTRVATNVLSGSSTGRISTKAVSATSRYSIGLTYTPQIRTCGADHRKTVTTDINASYDLDLIC
jgi:hypothetical protein